MAEKGSEGEDNIDFVACHYNKLGSSPTLLVLVQAETKGHCPWCVDMGRGPESWPSVMAPPTLYMYIVNYA